MKKILIVICLLVFSSPIVNAQAVGFKDVPTNFWAVQEISWAQETNLVKGYSNGTFRPNSTLTEAQLLVIILNYFQLEQETVTPYQHWADGLYKTAEKYNLPLKGYQSHKIREAAVSRGVLAQVLAQTQGINSKLENAVNWMFDEGITTGRLKNKKTKLEQYDPAGNMTRAQTAVFFKRISDLGINDYVLPEGTNDEELTLPWKDNRVPLDIPLFQSGDAYFQAYDKKAVQPTGLNWNGLSRFEGPKEFKSLWSMRFDYDRSPHTLTMLSNLPAIGSDGTLYIQEGYLYSSSNLGYLYAINTTGSSFGNNKSKRVIASRS